MTQHRELPWEEYSRAERLTEDDILAGERALGVRFPDDFIGLMVRHQGMGLEGWVLKRAKKRAVPLNALSFLTRRVGSERGSNLISACLTLRRNGYPNDLIPFANEYSQAHLALDYGTGGLPSVAYVYPREIRGDETEPLPGSRTNGYWSTVKVADSITDMLAKLEPE